MQHKCTNCDRHSAACQPVKQHPPAVQGEGIIRPSAATDMMVTDTQPCLSTLQAACLVHTLAGCKPGTSLPLEFNQQAVTRPSAILELADRRSEVTTLNTHSEVVFLSTAYEQCMITLDTACPCIIIAGRQAGSADACLLQTTTLVHSAYYQCMVKVLVLIEACSVTADGTCCVLCWPVSASLIINDTASVYAYKARQSMHSIMAILVSWHGDLQTATVMTLPVSCGCKQYTASQSCNPLTCSTESDL